MRREREVFLDILEAIVEIEKYASRGKEAFDSDELIKNWIVHHLEIIGEAAKRISSQTRQNVPDIPWRRIAGLRDKLIHEYFAVDYELVWSVVVEDLPRLRKAVAELLGEV